MQQRQDFQSRGDHGELSETVAMLGWVRIATGSSRLGREGAVLT